MEVANVLQAEGYDASEERKVPILKNWLGREGLQFIQTLINVEKVAGRSTIGMFNV